MDDQRVGRTVRFGAPRYLKSTLASARFILRFFIQRLLFALLVMGFIIFLSHLGIDMAEGTSIRLAAGQAARDSLTYISHLLEGDLGRTTAGSLELLPVPVGEVIQERLPRSLGLLSISLLFASLVGVSLGILAARSGSSRSLLIILFTLLGISVPSFFAAFLLQWALTSITRQAGRAILPVGGFGWDNHLVLPVLVLAARPVAQIMRITFVTVREVLGQDYIRTARSKGVVERQIVLAHVIKNAAIPILATIGSSLRFSLSSLPIVELYFGWPGAGFTLLKGIAWRDDNLTIGLALCLGIFFILVNLLLDLSYRLIDPRLLRTPDHIATSEGQNIWEWLKSTLSNAFEWIRQNLFQRRSRGKAGQSPGATKTPGPSSALAPEESLGLTGRSSNWLYPLHNLPLTLGGLLVVGLILVMILGPKLAPNNPYHIQGLVMVDGKLTTPPFAPDETYPWGTDALGRDILSLILAGARQTLLLAGFAVLARALLGVLLGALAGWKNGGPLDRFILGLAEVISAYPALLIAMLLILALGIRNGIRPFSIALGVIGWGEIMQFVRAEVIALRSRVFVESAVAIGARSSRIIVRHILPNLFAPLISIIALEIGAVLMLLGELGFIGIFIGGGSLIMLPSMTVHYSDVPEWGALLSNIRYQARSYPWTALYAMLAFFVSILSFNLLGEGLRRMLDEGRLILRRFFNRYTFALFILAALGMNWLSLNSGAMPFYRQHASEFREDLAYEHLEILTDPRMAGRSMGTDGVDLSALYIAKMFEEYGLQPGGEGNSYYQYRNRSYERLDSVPQLTIDDGGPELASGRDYAAYPGQNATIGEATAPVRFVGLGELAPVQTSLWRYAYPELDRADFSQDILLALSEREALLLTRKSKQGMLVVAEEESALGRAYTLSGRTGRSLDLSTGEYRGSETPYIWISKNTADRLLASSGHTVDELQKEISLLPHEEMWDFPIEQSVHMRVEGAIVEKFPVKNVIGMLPGTDSRDQCYDCLGNRLIVVMAQYDSPALGPGDAASPGANDNASGVAVMLEAMRVMLQTQYQPYKSFMFIAYSGEGLDGGMPVDEDDVNKFLQANPSFLSFSLESVVQLRGVGSGSGNGVEISASGSLRLAELFEQAARRMGVRSVRASEAMDIGLIYDEKNLFQKSGLEAPTVSLSWQGWEEHARLPSDTLEHISMQSLKDSGETLALALMIMGREIQY